MTTAHPRGQRCGASLILGASGGVAQVRFECELPKGHPGPHQEKSNTGSRPVAYCCADTGKDDPIQPFTIAWEGDAGPEPMVYALLGPTEQSER